MQFQLPSPLTLLFWFAPFSVYQVGSSMLFQVASFTCNLRSIESLYEFGFCWVTIFDYSFFKADLWRTNLKGPFGQIPTKIRRNSPTHYEKHNYYQLIWHTWHKWNGIPRLPSTITFNTSELQVVWRHSELPVGNLYLHLARIWLNSRCVSKTIIRYQLNI